MSAVGTITGKGGRVTLGTDASGATILRVTKWTLNPVSRVIVWGDSSSLGFDFQLSGRRGASGVVEGVFDSSTFFLREGNVLAMQLWLDSLGSSSNFFDIRTAVITAGPNYELDVDTERPVRWSFNYATSGPWYHPNDTVTITPPGETRPAARTYPG